MNEHGQQYLSEYAGIVKDNSDPLFLGRVKVQVGALGDEFTTEWAMPSGFMTGANSGTFFPPPVSAKVMVCFLEGDPEVPIYSGGFWSSPGGKPETPEEFRRSPPTNRGFKSPGGHLVEYDDEPNTQGIRITSKGKFKIHIDDKGKKLTLSTPGGQKFVFDDTAKKLDIVVKENETKNVQKDLTHTIGGKWTINVTGDASIKCTKAKIESSGNTEVQAGGDCKITAGGNCKVTASKIELNGSSSGVTTKNSHMGVIDLITGVPVQASPTVFADV